MPGFLIHVGALTNCLHPPGGSITVIPSNLRVKVNVAQPVLTVADIHKMVTKCSFRIPLVPPPGTKPQPCFSVRVEPAIRVRVNGVPAAILTPAVICLSKEGFQQGPPNSGLIQKRVVAT